jgi:magnesium-protoporphyrin O-methyltransferase
VPLALMHTVGKLFPRADRSPAIEPISPASLHKSFAKTTEWRDWQVRREHRVSTGFYTSQAMELTRLC